MIFNLKKKIYGFECDMYGHLNNAIYLQVFETARAEALSSIGMSVTELLEKGYMLYLTKVEIKFKKGIELEDIINVQSKIIEHNKMKFIWNQEIYNSKNELCTEATVTGVYVSKATKSITRIDNELCDFFDKYVKEN